MPEATFIVQDLADAPSETYDCVSVTDVLYCVPLAQWPEFLAHCTRTLKKGGLLIIKEVTNRPRWQHLLSYAQETLAIKVTKMTKGTSPHFESMDTYRSHIDKSEAWVYHSERLVSWRPYPHCLFLARKQ